MSSPDDDADAGQDPRPALPAAQVWLVDGFNALHHVLLGGESRERWWTGAARQRLLERVERFEDPAADLWVVFDGSHPDTEGEVREDGERPRVQRVFAPSADRWLLSRVREAADPAALGVVTADRKLAGRCRHAGAHVVAPRDFLAHCPSAERADPPGEPGEEPPAPAG